MHPLRHPGDPLGTSRQACASVSVDRLGATIATESRPDDGEPLQPVGPTPPLTTPPADCRRSPGPANCAAPCSRVGPIVGIAVSPANAG